MDIKDRIMAKWLKYRAWWLMALPLIAACGDDAPAVPAADEVRYSDVPIVPTASIVSAKLSRADFEGPVNGTTFTPSTTKIFGVTAYLGYDVPTEWSSNSRLNFSAVNCNDKGTYEFDEWKYYPLDYRTYFYAFSPMIHCTYSEGSATEHPKVTYTITGREDVMWSRNTDGILKHVDPAKQEQPNFQFSHRLQRVIFQVRRTASVPATVKIDRISIKGLYNVCTLDIVTGELTFDYTQPPVSLTASYSMSPTTEYQTYPFDIMFEAGVKEFDITLVLDGTNYDAHVTLSGEHAGEAGYKHIVKLTVDGVSLNLETPQIVEWDDFSTSGTI